MIWLGFAQPNATILRYVGEREGLREIEMKNGTKIAKTENKIKNQAKVIGENGGDNKNPAIIKQKF